MRALSVFLILALSLGLLSIVSCPKPDDEMGATDLLEGTWYLSELDAYYEVTSAINQTAISSYAVAVGSIELSGLYTASLNYLILSEENVLVTNLSMFLEPGSSQGNGYMLMLSEEDAVQSAMLLVYYNMDSTAMWWSQNVEFNYDRTLSSLDIEDMVLYPFFSPELDSSDFIGISGSLANQTFDINAGVTTQLPMDIVAGAQFESTALFESNGTLTLLDQYDGFIDTLVYDWELDGDQMHWILVGEDEWGEYRDTTVVSYSVTETELIINMEEDCSGPGGNVQMCLQEVEQMFLLESGSLNAAMRVSDVVFSKQAGAMGLKHLSSKFRQSKQALMDIPQAY